MRGSVETQIMQVVCVQRVSYDSPKEFYSTGAPLLNRTSNLPVWKLCSMYSFVYWNLYLQISREIIRELHWTRQRIIRHEFLLELANTTLIVERRVVVVVVPVSTLIKLIKWIFFWLGTICDNCRCASAVFCRFPPAIFSPWQERLLAQSPIKWNSDSIRPSTKLQVNVSHVTDKVIKCTKQAETNRWVAPHSYAS